MNETWVTVVGNVATEVISRQTANTNVVVSFSVASSERRRDPGTGEWADGDRLYARVSCWGALGQNVLLSLHKGDPVVIRGRMSTREYEAEGLRRSSVDIRAVQVGPDLARSRALVSRVRAADVLAMGRPVEAPTGPIDVSHLTVAGDDAGDLATAPQADVWSVPGRPDPATAADLSEPVWSSDEPLDDEADEEGVETRLAG